MPLAMILVAGHACLDLIPELTTPLPAPGGLVGTGKLRFSPGGVVSNTGLALHRLGIPVRLVAPVGDDLLGGCLRALYESELGGRDAACLRAVAGEPTSYSVVLSPPGEDRRFLHCPGVNATFTDADLEPAHLTGCRHLHVGYPTVMPGLYRDRGSALERLFRRARDAGLTTSLDLCFPDRDGLAADWPSIFERVLPLVEIFCPSLDEVRVCLGIGDDTAQGSPDRLAERFLSMGAAAVLLKQGENGVLLRTSAGATDRGLPKGWSGVRMTQPCYRVDVVGTTGSGDTTVAGLLAACWLGLSPREALRLACGVGACCCEQADATSGIPPLETVRRRISQGWEMLGAEG